MAVGFSAKDIAAVGYENGLQGLPNPALEKASTWLKTVFTAPQLHKSAIVAGALLQGTNAVTNVHRYGKIGSALNNVIATVGSFTDDILTFGGAGGVADKVLNEMNAILDELKNPNIGGIPIHADGEVENYDNDVSQNLYINQSSAWKEYRMDNVTPKPKTWQIRGYLKTAIPNALEAGLIIKPSLLAQRALLEHYAETRMPVVFKTHDNRFYTVVITHFDTAYTVQAIDALMCNISLQEFNVLEVKSEMKAFDILQQAL